MSEQKCISTNETNPPRASSTKSTSKTEPVIEGPTFSYYWCVACAVAITAVILGVYYFYLKPQILGLVFYRETIFHHRIIIGTDWGCENAFGGKSTAGMLKKQFKRISETKNIFVIEDDPTLDISQTEDDITICMQWLGLSKEFKNVYVWQYKNDERLNEINRVIKKTELEGATLQFICRTGPKCDFLKDNKFNVFKVDDYIQESDFQGMISQNTELTEHE